MCRENFSIIHADHRRRLGKLKWQRRGRRMTKKMEKRNRDEQDGDALDEGECGKRGELNLFFFFHVSSAGLVQVTTSQDGVWKLPSACPVDPPSQPNNEARQLESRHAIQLVANESRRLLYLHLPIYVFPINIHSLTSPSEPLRTPQPIPPPPRPSSTHSINYMRISNIYRPTYTNT